MVACERCGKRPDGRKGETNDYCAFCSKVLCPDCMSRGCCGRHPAISALEQHVVGELSRSSKTSK